MVYGVFEPVLAEGYFIQDIGFILRTEVRGNLQIEYDFVNNAAKAWIVLVYEDSVYEEAIKINLNESPLEVLMKALKQIQQIYSGLIDLKLGETQ